MNMVKFLVILVTCIAAFTGGNGFPGRAATAVSAAPAAAAASNAWIDQFDATAINARWSWVREDPTRWSLTAKPGFLQLTANGTLFADYNNAKNILLTAAPDGDFRLVTRVSISPTENYQAGALMVYQDDDHYLELTRYSGDGNQIVAFNKTWGADWVGAGLSEPATYVYLRIDRRGNEYAGYYSLDNIAWTFVGAQTIAFTQPRLGIYASVGPGAELPALYDFVSLAPITAFRTAFTDQFDSATLNSPWSWVREDPAHWSLTAVPGKLQITAQAGSLYSNYNNTQNILLTSAPAGDFRIETKVDFSPTEFLQSAGLLVYQDDDNYIHFSRAFDQKQEIEFRADTAAGYRANTRDFTAATTYLRIEREGKRYYGSYSEDGVNWDPIDSVTLDLTNVKVGFAAHGGPSSLNPNAQFDFFSLSDTTQVVFLPMAMKPAPNAAPKWALVSVPTQTPLFGIGMVSANDIWVVGANPLKSEPKSPAILHWNGSGWSTVQTPNSTDLLSDIDFISPDDGWLVGTCVDYHVNGVQNGMVWSSYSVPSCNYIKAVDMVSSTDVWAASYSAILHWDGKAWTSAYSPGDPWLNDIAMVSASDGWAVSNGGKIYHYNGSAWSESASFSRGLYAISMVSASNGWIVGAGGTILHWDGSAWSEFASPSTDYLMDISMYSASAGWVVGSKDILAWNGTQWEKQVNPSTQGLNAVQAVSDKEAWAAGWGGTILHLQP